MQSQTTGWVPLAVALSGTSRQHPDAALTRVPVLPGGVLVPPLTRNTTVPCPGTLAVMVPVLLLQGTKDFQVDDELDFVPLRAVLDGRKNSEAVLVEGVDHLFKPEAGESKVAHYGDLSRRVDPGVIDRIVRWAAARAGLAD